MTNRLSSLIFILVIMMVFASCDNAPIKRRYTEVTFGAREEGTEQEMAVMPLPEGHPSIDRSDMANVESLQVRDMLQGSVASVNLRWKTPADWQEEPGDGMRLVSFTTQGKTPILCTITSLGGMAGGVEANIQRWMRQINLTDVPSSAFQNFLNRQVPVTSKGGLTALVFDFTELQQTKSGEVSSMISAIIDVQEKSIFVKMTGTKEAIAQNRRNFDQLIKSLQLSDE